MHKTITGCLALAITFTGGSAFAQEFSDQGTLSFSADRLFGVYVTQRNTDWDDRWDWDDDEDDGTDIGLLWQGDGMTPYTIPRLSVDYFVINHLSIGGTVAYYNSEEDDDNDFDHSGFLFGPRVGGAWMFAPWVGIWPRGGLHYYSGEWGNNDWWQLALNLEAAFVFVPREGWAFTVGPAFDIGLTGEFDPPGRGEGDLNMHSFGIISAGLMGYLNL
jgi:hypothetical protein